MRRLVVTTGLVLLWALTVTSVVVAEAYWFPGPPVVRSDFGSIERHLVGVLQEAVEDRRLGSAALVLVRDGEIAAEHGFGVADAETGAAVDPERTLYQLGSVSKAVTAWGVMRLVQEGTIGLDEPVNQYLERWRLSGAHADGVTVRQLLSHTAGIEDPPRTEGALPGESLPTLESYLAGPAGEDRGAKVVREPGTAMAYSPAAGYAILQLLVEEVTGRQFADHMGETVLRPLGMTRSTYDVDAIAAEGRARDLAAAFDRSLTPQPHRRYTPTAAIALYASPRDLARFVAAYAHENRVLAPETLDAMMTAQPATEGTWGLGQTLYAETDGAFVVGHSGAAQPATGASIRVNPRSGNGFVLVSSGGRGAANRLPHDWVYWETGIMPAEGRRQLMYDRLLGRAGLAIVVGAAAIVLLRFGRWPRRRSS